MDHSKSYSHTLHIPALNKIIDFCVTSFTVLYKTNTCIFTYTASTSRKIIIQLLLFPFYAGELKARETKVKMSRDH